LISLFSVPFPRKAPQVTVTVKEQSVICPLGAMARQVFVVVPAGKIEPLAKPLNRKGASVPAQLSEAVGGA